MTLMSSPGRLAGGWFADKWNVKYLYAIVSAVQAGGLFVLARATSMSWVWAFVVIYGASYGARIVFEPVLRAQHFGLKAFASIYGYMNAFAQVGSFAAPYFAGWIFDTTHSYVTAFLTFAVMMVVAAVLILFLKSPTKAPAT